MDQELVKQDEQGFNGSNSSDYKAMANKKRKYDENVTVDVKCEDENGHDNGNSISYDGGGDLIDNEKNGNDGSMNGGSNGNGMHHDSSLNGAKAGMNMNGSKRTQRVITGDNEVYLKLLIPSTVAGGVIGRGGERIAQIQKDTNVKMKMSKALDYYPNTNERVCLIIGSIKSVLRAHELIVERIQEKTNADAAESQSNKSSHHDEHDRCNQIKLLIPNNTAGLLIGKGGAYIKQIKDESGSFVQISSKQTELPERIVTIEGDMEKRTRALQMVIKKIAEDPSHNSVTTLTYNSNAMHGHGNQGMLNHNNNGNSIDHHQSLQLGGNCNGNMMSNQAPNNKYDFNSAAIYLAGLSNLALLIINCGGSFQMTSENLKIALRNAGYSSSASSEIIEAITLLMGYGLITKMPPNGANGNNNGNQNSYPSLLGNMNAPGFNFMPGNANMGMLGSRDCMNNAGLVGNSNHNGVGREHHSNPSLMNGNSNSSSSMNGFGGSANSLNGGSNGNGGGSSILPMFANGGYGGGGGNGAGLGVVNNGKLKSFF